MRKNKNNAIWSVIAAVLTAMGVSVKIGRVEHTGKWFTDFVSSFASNKIQLLLIATALFFLFFFANLIKQKKGERIYLIIFSVLFSFFQVIGASFIQTNDWELVFGSSLGVTRASILFVSIAVTCYAAVKVVTELCFKYCNSGRTEETGFSWKFVLKTAIILFVCWLPYYILFFPATSNPDTISMIMQFLHYPATIRGHLFTDLTSVKWADTYITNHHPVFLTVIFGLFAKFGMLLGNIKYGIAVYTVLQMATFAFTFSCCLAYLKRIGVGRSVTNFIKWFLAFCPVFAVYSVCMLKDTVFSMCTLVLCLLIFEIVRTKGNSLKSVKFCVMLTVAALLFMLTKNQGVYILFLVTIVILIVYRKMWKPLLCTLVAALIVFQVGFQKILLPSLHIAPSGIQETLSVPFQQTARYLLEYPDDVKDSEKDAINKILDYENIAKLYKPGNSDFVKFTYKQDASKEDLLKYFKVWAKMGLRHPDSYLKSTLNGTYAYFYLGRPSYLGAYKFYQYVGYNKDNPYPELFVEPAHEKYLGIDKAFGETVQLLQKIPVVNLIYSVGMMPWFVLLAGFFIIKNKKYRYLISLFIPLLSVAVCVVSPVNGNWRYSMPVMFSMLFILPAIMLRKNKNTDAVQNKGE